MNFSDKRSVPQRCLGLKIGGKQIALYPQKAVYEISVDDNVHHYSDIVGGILYDKKGRMEH